MAYITGGDPTPEKTVDIALALSKAGVDFLEIGVPFSDPLADGVANQLGAQRALAAGTTVPKLLKTIVENLKKGNVKGLSCLVIDDEADQAGLNTQVGRGRESTTYQRLVALRQCLPHHTYLQYTATPQAPLLINLIDTLSPRFAELLTPGNDYVGGEGFFEEISVVIRNPVEFRPSLPREG